MGFRRGSDRGACRIKEMGTMGGREAEGVAYFKLLVLPKLSHVTTLRGNEEPGRVGLRRPMGDGQADNERHSTPAGNCFRIRNARTATEYTQRERGEKAPKGIII